MDYVHINWKSKMHGIIPLGEAVHCFGWCLKKGILKRSQDLGSNFNELGKYINKMVRLCVKNWDDIEFIKTLVQYGSKIDAQIREGLCVLCFGEKKGKNDLGGFRMTNWNYEKTKFVSQAVLS